MTGCANRRAYIHELETLEDKGERRSFLAIDINGLKGINDTLGHDAGDKLIIGAAECIKESFQGTVFRTGGDEFVVLAAEDIPDAAFAAYEKRMKSWTKQNDMELSTSYGYARYEEYPEVSLYDLARIADGKMFQAKALFYRQTAKERRTHVYQ